MNSLGWIIFGPVVIVGVILIVVGIHQMRANAKRRRQQEELVRSWSMRPAPPPAPPRRNAEVIARSRSRRLESDPQIDAANIARRDAYDPLFDPLNPLSPLSPFNPVYDSDSRCHEPAPSCDSAPCHDNPSVDSGGGFDSGGGGCDSGGGGGIE